MKKLLIFIIFSVCFTTYGQRSEKNLKIRNDLTVGDELTLSGNFIFKDSVLISVATGDTLTTNEFVRIMIRDSIAKYNFITLGTDGQVPYMNPAGSDYLYTNNFRWFGTYLNSPALQTEIITNSYTNYITGNTASIELEDNSAQLNSLTNNFVYAARVYVEDTVATIQSSNSDISFTSYFKHYPTSFNFGKSLETPLMYGNYPLNYILISGDLHTTGHLDVNDSIRIDGHFIRWNESEGVYEFGTGKSDVVWQGALEDLVQVYNNTGSQIDNFTPVYFSGSNGDSILTANVAYCSIDSTTINVCGLSTVDIPNGEWGYIATRGKVRGGNTSSLSTIGCVYLGEGDLTMTKPAYPCKVLNIGKCIKVDAVDGVVHVNISHEEARLTESKDYNFTSQGIGVGTFYRAGFYRAATTSATLTQASPTITYGTANAGYAAHFFVVCGGAGTVDAGVVGLEISGTSVSDNGTYTTSDKDTIITDITSTALNNYFEGKKFNGIVTFKLIIISGSPTTYSLTFNMGYAKYDDLNNRNFYITGIEAVGLAGAASTSFDMTLLKHSNQGWTYSASAFVPGGTVIAKRSVDLGSKDDLINGLPFAWKRDNLNEYAHGANGDGFVIRITTGANNAVQSMDVHVQVSIDK